MSATRIDKELYGNNAEGVLYEMLDTLTQDNQIRIKGRQVIYKALRAAKHQLLDELMEQKRSLLDTDTASLIKTDRGEEHPIIEAVPVLAIEALKKGLK